MHSPGSFGNNKYCMSPVYWKCHQHIGTLFTGTLLFIVDIPYFLSNVFQRDYIPLDIPHFAFGNGNMIVWATCCILYIYNWRQQLLLYRISAYKTSVWSLVLKTLTSYAFENDDMLVLCWCIPTKGMASKLLTCIQLPCCYA